METRACNQCKEVKPRTLEYFYKAVDSKDKIGNKCKVCTLENARLRKLANPPKQKEKVVKTKQSPGALGYAPRSTRRGSFLGGNIVR